ncbi:hypothetical protein PROFUN_00186 [Planoprotostelium fungivorum]|uniref:DUF1996 domain-containing protein n=1 Tax=Planoprotostelium fungivorum TaxID=1890364 RepID=A0A2P6P0W1_9EUKA|nr:hypothetical protein PROFUN_00186 [Planoprotostelium fungivorum]
MRTAALLLFLALGAAVLADPVTDRWNLNYPDDQNYSPFWRLLCKTRPIYTGRADPIIVQGSWAGHVFGSAGFSKSRPGQTPLEFYNDLVNASCTSCNIAKMDMSVYWHPELYYRRPDGTGYEIVKGEGLTVYYLSRRGGKPNWWIPFPKGFRMIAGNQERRSFDPNNVGHKAISYSCYGGNGFTGTPVEMHGFPGYQNKSIGCSAIRLQIFFPSCWNGRDLDVPDHTSHMSYPIGDGISQGDCPSTHPYRLPGIFFEAFYNTGDYPHGDGRTEWPFVLSQSDLTGYGMHGDFVSGWDEEALHRALHEPTCNCGNVDCCNVFKANQQGAGLQCPMDKPMGFFEDVGLSTAISQLPGCNRFTGVGPNAPGCPPPSPATFTGSTGIHRVFIASGNQGILTPPWNEPWDQVTIHRNVLDLDNVWRVLDIGGGVVTFQNSLSRGWLVHWVDTEVLSMQQAEKDVVKNDWYHWSVVDQGNGLSLVKSLKDGSYLTYRSDGKVTAEKRTNGTSQLWVYSDKTRWTPDGQPQPDPTAAPTTATPSTTVAPQPTSILTEGAYKLKLTGGGQFVKSDSQGNIKLSDDGSVFVIRAMGNQGYSIFSSASQRFVCADGAGSDFLIANRGAASGWETFQLSSVGSSWTVQSSTNNKYVARQSNGKLMATGVSPGADSLWTLISA